MKARSKSEELKTYLPRMPSHDLIESSVARFVTWPFNPFPLCFGGVASDVEGCCRFSGVFEESSQVGSTCYNVVGAKR
jgi:hypothetical protein